MSEEKAAREVGPHKPRWRYDSDHDVYRCAVDGCTFGHIGGVSTSLADQAHDEMFGQTEARDV